MPEPTPMPWEIPGAPQIGGLTEAQAAAGYEGVPVQEDAPPPFEGQGGMRTVDPGQYMLDYLARQLNAPVGVYLPGDALRMPREIRVLRDALKQALLSVKAERRAHGATQRKIYELRCQLAEARTMFTVDPSSHRALLARANRYGRTIAEQEEKMHEMRTRIAEMEGGYQVSIAEFEPGSE